jgi:excinuclease ABC subunit C
MTDIEKLKEKAGGMPDMPGVYLMKDKRGRVIYVGKAKSLPKRVSTYFQKNPGSHKTARMVEQVEDVDFIVTENEKEAFILENSLIKEHRPRYNIILRDDKTYPYLRLTVQEDWPRLEVVRRIQKDGAVYFGPFSSATSMRRTIRLIRDLFPLRQCRQPDPKVSRRPCLNNQLGRCLGPCTGLIGLEEYRALVDEVILFFKGRNRALTDRLEAKMKEAAERLDFEAAARYRDRLAAVERTLERQKVVTSDMVDRDVIGLARDRGRIMAVIMFVRRGALLGTRNLPLKGESESDEEVVSALLVQYYGGDHLVPAEVLIPVELEDREPLEELLREKREKPVRLLSPVRGPKRQLVEMAARNAATALAEKLRTADLGTDALVELQMKLGLPSLPRRIETYDMSTLRGEAPVGAMVVLEEGVWVKSDYRRYKIKTASGDDDYAMMSEVLGRRLAKEDLPRPDLILLDGGRGQIGVALAVIEDLGIENPPPLAGLAKGREGEADKVWLPGRKNPVDIRSDAPALLLLMRARDEAHRYVQDYHHRVRARQTARSVLDDIPGIGPARRKALLQHFGSFAAIKEASVEALTEAKGMSEKTAQAVYEFFRSEK